MGPLLVFATGCLGPSVVIAYTRYARRNYMIESKKYFDTKQTPDEIRLTIHL